ncbi:L,D-transpeptidase family protein [Streptomyces sp. enrichment culture]|uniref:L,D-transpeptidase family protein n=1 Tax=Streptomyces sp. enrichment culture TaxID=1795815 RepID=UPI003F55A287
MRGTGTGRNGIAVLAALTALAAGAAGCTVRPAGADGEGGPPVRIEVPGRTPSGAPAPSRAPEGAGKPSARGGPASPRPASRVLWSPGDSGRDVRELQARLRQVAWIFHGPTGTYDDLTAKAVRGFQGRRGLPATGVTDRATWQRLVAMTREPGRWELYLMGGQPADAPDPRCRTGRVLCVSKTSRTLRWMVDGRTVSTMPVRFGSEYTPTREGVFRIYWKSRHHVSTLYDSPMPYAMFFSGGQAVHFSADFAARGYAGSSHGCVNVRDEEAIARLYEQVRDGDRVVVHR